MNPRICTLTIIACFTAWFTNGETVNAAFTFLGPTPYLSAADSPFNLSGLGTTFFLEDFEDDVLTPGVEIGFPFPGATKPVLGNSVDGDDGVIDGHDSNGQSIWATSHGACAGNACTVHAQWTFDMLTSGSFPTAVGFVITANSGAAGKIVIEAYAAGVYEQEVISFNQFSSNPHDATDDLFVGFINPLGIFSISIEQLRQPTSEIPYFSPSFDHLQYGLLVPEPNTLFLLITASAMIGSCRFKWAIAQDARKHF